ncbi:hypothetical protein TH63_12850 [Rufibacter radiotolerans]|uniref:Leucine-rich repeat domain-containing protein n=1 Tax=Rufibacter radiotolerans TaxID=1379910 RepID=A0A0H4VKI4_9BACT|nr:hypothetical protein [Rufibacter radiotolerans]AKQ46310.1 hypothetical protein TH63_12850 [Rufibacter radiotolerans]
MKIQNRFQNPERIDRNLIERELKEGKEVIVQYSEGLYNDKILSEINELCSVYDENFGVRFYGHYSGSFDCKVVGKIPNVKSLYLDCLIKADNLLVVTKLKNLKKLSLGVFELKEVDFFNADNLKNLNDLIITDTRTKALNLDYLKEYNNLTSLTICGHTKNIDAIGELSDLEYLGLNSISKVPLDFINRLRKLKTLNFVLGGRENINEIEENNIENLEIIRVRGFKSFTNISNFNSLKKLLIEDQIQLPELIFDKPFNGLEDLRLINCKTFNKLQGIRNLPSLKQLRIYRTDIDFNSFIKQPFPKYLDILAFYTSKSKVDKEIKAILGELGYWDGMKK